MMESKLQNLETLFDPLASPKGLSNAEILILITSFSAKGVKNILSGHIKVARKRLLTNLHCHIGKDMFQSKKVFHQGGCFR